MIRGVVWPRGLFTLLLLVLLLMVFVGRLSGTQQTPEDHDLPIYDLALDHNDTHHIYWRVNYKEKQIRFEIHSRTASGSPWLAIGFSDRGELPGADLCVFWTDWKNRIHFQNSLVDDTGRLVVVEETECHQFRYKIQKQVIKFTYTRKFDTCTPSHYVIKRGTTHIVWSHGQGPLYRLGGLLASGDETGMVRAQLLKPQIPKYEVGSDAKVLQVVVNKVAIPDDETTYWCSVQKLPDEFNRKHHVVQYGPSITAGNEDVVHHMEVFHCEFPTNVEVPRYQGPCRSKDRPPEIEACKRVLAAWAMGASVFTYPVEAGLSVGGKDFGPFVMLEVHYNNPKKYSGRIDSSGIALHYTNKLRRYDVGIMELGLEYIDKMAIPPKLPSFVLSGHCIPECTALGLPRDGIYIFGSQLHTHGTGIRAWASHVRGGKEQPELNRDNHYSTHFQEIRRLHRPVNVLPGDALIMSCEYSTIDRPNVTVGGFAISDEMCVNYIHYYPKVDLEVCKSSIDTTALKEYFNFMNKWELQNSTDETDVTKNYHSIDWTPLRASLLSKWYDESPLSMQCNRSSGERFPGYWDNMPQVKILHPLPPEQSACPSSEPLPPDVNQQRQQSLLHDLL